MNYIIFQIACFQFHADFEQISQKMDIKIAYMARGNSTLIFAKITSLRFASGDSIFHNTGGGIWYEKILPKKISPPFLMNLFWDYSLVESTTFIPNSKEEEKSPPKRPKIWFFFSLIRSKSSKCHFQVCDSLLWWWLIYF